MTLHPTSMGLISRCGSHITLDDELGFDLKSIAKLSIVGGGITFDAPKINLKSPKEINMMKVDTSFSTVYSSIVMCNQFDIIAKNGTRVTGTVFTYFEPFDDAPVEQGFDWGGLFGNVLAGLAVVAVVATAIVLTVGTGGLAAPAVIGGAIAIGSVFVLHKSYKDYQSGEVSHIGEYLLTGLYGGVTGAIFALGFAATYMKGIQIMAESARALSAGLIVPNGALISKPAMWAAWQMTKGGVFLGGIESLRQLFLVKPEDKSAMNIFSMFLSGATAISAAPMFLQVLFNISKSGTENVLENDYYGFTADTIIDGTIAVAGGHGMLNNTIRPFSEMAEEFIRENLKAYGRDWFWTNVSEIPKQEKQLNEEGINELVKLIAGTREGNTELTEEEINELIGKLRFKQIGGQE